MKDIEFHPAALKAIKKFPDLVKKELGARIKGLQRGDKLSMPLSRPLKQVGRGVEELRIKDASGIYRAFYLTRLKGRIIVFHAFMKKTQKTLQKEISTGQRRLKELSDD